MNGERQPVPIIMAVVFRMSRWPRRRAHRVGLSAAQDETAGQSGRRVYRTDDYAVFYAAPDARRITFDVRKASDHLTGVGRPVAGARLRSRPALTTAAAR